jgi:hypothetical protein
MIVRVLSGGQTGVDRAALDAARSLGIPCGGWCPRGRWSESGPIPPHYPLSETPSADPAQRTEWNVRDADATLIIAPGPLTGGTSLTQRIARRLGRPVLVVEPGRPPPAAEIVAWLRGHGVRTLNVAGPRESGSPGIGEAAGMILRSVLASARE